VSPPGLEPGLQDPQSCVLSLELRRQIISDYTTTLKFVSIVQTMADQFFLNPHQDI
jgi:hypothetical protein